MLTTSISCTVLLCLGIVIEIDIMRVIQIVIKPDKIFALIKVTVYQRDAVKKQSKKLIFGLREFPYETVNLKYNQH